MTTFDQLRLRVSPKITTLDGVVNSNRRRAAVALPFNGTWKLNTAKSKYVPGPGPQSQTVTIKVEGDTQNVKGEGKTSDGTPIETSFVVKLDGTPAPVTGSTVADMISVRKINDHTLESKTTKGGSPVGQSRVTVSPDGKVLTITGSGLNWKGVKTKSTAVYEKQ